MHARLCSMILPSVKLHSFLLFWEQLNICCKFIGYCRLQYIICLSNTLYLGMGCCSMLSTNFRSLLRAKGQERPVPQKFLASGAQICYKQTQFAPKCPDWSLKSAISGPRSGQNLPLKSAISRTRFRRSFPGPILILQNLSTHTH